MRIYIIWNVNVNWARNERTEESEPGREREEKCHSARVNREGLSVYE